MNAQEFYQTINDMVNGEGIPYEKEYLTDILMFAPKSHKIELSGDFLRDLFHNYYTANRVIGVQFNAMLETEGDYLFFASRDIDKIGLDTKSGAVIFYDFFTQAVTFRLAPDMQRFIRIMLLILETELPHWCKEKPYDTLDTKGLCREITQLISEEYHPYYLENYGE